MGYILNLNKARSLSYIQQESDIIFGEHGVLYDINPQLNIQFAATYTNHKNTAYKTEIGVREICHAKRRFPYLKSSVIQDEDFVAQHKDLKELYDSLYSINDVLVLLVVVSLLGVLVFPLPSKYNVAGIIMLLPFFPVRQNQVRPSLSFV